MARNASGTYTLPSGNPVVSGTLIDATWANNTLSDLGNEMTDSLSRSGEGAMLAPLRITDGVQATPSLAFSNEPSSGLYRAGSNEWWAVAAGVQNLRFTNTGLTTRAAAGAVGTPSLAAFNDTDTGIYFPGANELAIATGGAARMTFDSAGAVAVPGTFSVTGNFAVDTNVLFVDAASNNLGIGTASPAYKLDVRGAATDFGGLNVLNTEPGSGTQTTSSIRLGITNSIGIRNTRITAVEESVDSNAVGLAFFTNNTNALNAEGQRMYLDSSGNLGIGTASPTVKLDVNRGSSGVVMNLNGVNAYDAETGITFSEGRAKISGFLNSSGGTPGSSLRFYTMPDGGSITERGRFTSGGLFQVNADSTNTTFTSPGQIALKRSNSLPFISWHADNGTRNGYLQINDASASTLSVEANQALTFQTNAAERARITSDGKFISNAAAARISVEPATGTNSAFVSFVSSAGANNSYVGIDSSVGGLGTGGYSMALWHGANYPLVFATNNTDRGRFTADGNFLVGKAVSNDTTVGFGIGAFGTCASTNSDSTNSTVTYAVYSTGSSAYRFYVGLGGTVYATNTTISAISDQRYKENIRDLDIGLDAVMALKPRKFDWKEGKGKDIKNDRGFIAQEFEQVFPDLIDEWKDPAPEGEESYKSVRQDLIPVLVKAMQEQQAMIEALKAKVAALEAK